MVGMGFRAGSGAVALVVMMAASGAMGAPKCAVRDEVTAIQAEMIHEQLMVAGISCNQLTSFNTYMTNFNAELRRSDATLKRMFHRLFARDGEDKYNSFKTKVAGDAEIRRIHDYEAYCHDTGVVFEAALIADKPSLAGFVSGIEVAEPAPVASCDVNTAASAAIPAVAPKPNPQRLAALAEPAGPAAPAATNAANLPVVPTGTN